MRPRTSCHISYPLIDWPDPSKTQYFMGSVLKNIIASCHQKYAAGKNSVRTTRGTHALLYLMDPVIS